MAWTNDLLAAHEAGHWVAAYVCGVPTAGVVLSLQDPCPGMVRISRGRFIDLHARSMIAFGGHAGEVVRFGREQADFNHALVDLRLLGDRHPIDAPMEQAEALLRRHSDVFTAVTAVLTDAIESGQTGVQADVLEQVAQGLGLAFGVERVTATYQEGQAWLALACRKFQDRQQTARDVAITATNSGELTATVKVHSAEQPDSSTFANDWPAFQQGIAEAGFSVLSTNAQDDNATVNRMIKLLFTADNDTRPGVP
jgi:hypothetical protein